jgi:hypothetical protein
MGNVPVSSYSVSLELLGTQHQLYSTGKFAGNISIDLTRIKLPER